MTNYTYKRDIPDGPNNPSVDQPNMKINTNSIDSIIAEDHYSFGVNDGGLHKQVRMPILLAQPGSLPADGGTLYVKDAETTSGVNRGQLFYSTDNVGAATNEFQLTRAITAHFATFGTNTPYQNPVGPGLPNANNPIINGGWTFLPGGLIMFYGFATPAATSGSSGTVNFPFSTLSNIFSVQIQMLRVSTNADMLCWVTSVSTSGFTYFVRNATPTGIYFTAIGK